MSNEKAKPTIKVTDRRRFNADGEAKSDAPESQYQPPTLMHKPGNAPAQGKSTPPAAANETTSASGLTFMSFIASLATNALAAMGLLPEAQARGMTVSLPLAREYIDIITMLQERTRGNLREEEEQGLQRLLGDLKFQYVECQKSQNSPPPPR